VDFTYIIIVDKWCILGHLPSYPICKQAQIIVVCMTLYNFIRYSALYDNDFENYEDEFPEDFHDEASIGIDEYDMVLCIHEIVFWWIL
jgi:hypothetical protein